MYLKFHKIYVLMVIIMMALPMRRVAKWPRFGKELFTCLTVRSGCNLFVCNLNCFPFWLRGRGLVLAVPVPGHCMICQKIT